MKLQSLHAFESLPHETIRIITGGLAEDSKKGDVSSTSKDSKKDDGKPKTIAQYP